MIIDNVTTMIIRKKNN